MILLFLSALNYLFRKLTSQ